MLIKKFYKEMTVEFVASEEAITFKVILTQENTLRRTKCRVKIFENEKLNIVIYNNHIIKNCSRYFSLVLNNLLSSRRIVEEFPSLKEVEKELNYDW